MTWDHFLSPLAFCFLIEKTIESVIRHSVPSAWDENTITNNIIADFKKVLDSQFIIHAKRSNPSVVQWYPYKARGAVENTYGDIAIIVQISAEGLAKPIVGIGFLEAKRRYVRSKRFAKIAKPQLETILHNAPHSLILLYDYDNVTTFADNMVFGYPGETIKPFIPVTRSVVVPINIVLATNLRNTSLYRFSLPFSYQLAFRYLNGFDLEYEKSSFTSVTNAIRDDHHNFSIYKSPKYLLVFSVGKDGVTPSSVDEIPVNRDLYTSFS
jgi:hypothetical protein